VTVALYCVMVASILPILATGMAKWGFRGFDNHQPREWLARQQGWRARANAAQQNSWEALAIFAAGVFAAHLAGAPRSTVDAIAVAFIFVRLAYLVCYVRDWSTLRSLVWAVGLGLSLSLYFLAPQRG
jgi:uncharacterized MAPEG superfamily protein